MTERRSPVILLTGANGQVGWELRQTLAPLGTVVAHDRSTLDMTDLDGIRGVINSTAPDVIVNAAAYTQVDKAESEPALAHLVNAAAPAVMAAEAARTGAVLIHYSTDYVFDGSAAAPYREADSPAPTSVYGLTKHEGDIAILNSTASAWIFRVAWVYGMRGKNFLRTVQRLAGEGNGLRIVSDQHGAPTWSRVIAEATAAALSQILDARALGATAPASGVYHMAAPDNTTWAEFAQAIIDESFPPGNRSIVTPIATREYPTPARRPSWSVLEATRLRDAFGLTLPPWREQLRACLASPQH